MVSRLQCAGAPAPHLTSHASTGHTGHRANSMWSELLKRLRTGFTVLTACCRILTAQDYALVLGMPGTGKTAVICAAVRSLLAARRTVLVTSYTNRCSRHAMLCLVSLSTIMSAPLMCTTGIMASTLQLVRRSKL